MFRIPSLRSRINELESDNECLRRIQYELLTTNSILTGNISDLKVEVEHFREEAELNDDRALQTQIECDTLLGLNEDLQAENTGLLDDNARLLRDNTGLLDDNARLLNALREAKEKLVQLEYAVVQPAPVEEPEDVRPKWVPSREEAIKLHTAGRENWTESDFIQHLDDRDSKLRKEVKDLQTFGGYAADEIALMNDTAARIQKIIDGDLNA